MNPFTTKFTLSATRPFRTNILSNLSAAINRQQQQQQQQSQADNESPLLRSPPPNSTSPTSSSNENSVEKSFFTSPIFRRRHYVDMENRTPVSNRRTEELLFSPTLPSVLRQKHLDFRSTTQGSPSINKMESSLEFNSKRKLFLDSGIDTDTTNSFDEFYEKLITNHENKKNNRWNFNFKENIPVEQSTPFDRLKWKNFKNPPQFYRAPLKPINNIDRYNIKKSTSILSTSIVHHDENPPNSSIIQKNKFHNNNNNNDHYSHDKIRSDDNSKNMTELINDNKISRNKKSNCKSPTSHIIIDRQSNINQTNETINKNVSATSDTNQIKLSQIWPIRKKKRTSIQLTIESAKTFLTTPSKDNVRPLTRLQKKRQQKNLHDFGIQIV
ncbi:hypothetical protein SNEBB_006141 [Seison nebaliae]|nr:hypothetical protein SNEBB_006141 [Seison nebaliae]